MIARVAEGDQRLPFVDALGFAGRYGRGARVECSWCEKRLQDGCLRIMRLLFYCSNCSDSGEGVVDNARARVIDSNYQLPCPQVFFL
jgi:hypothetical protein